MTIFFLFLCRRRMMTIVVVTHKKIAKYRSILKLFIDYINIKIYAQKKTLMMMMSDDDQLAPPKPKNEKRFTHTAHQKN